MTRDALIADLERRVADAERMQATAPVATVLRSVIEDLHALNGGTASDSAAPNGDGPARLLTVAEAAAIIRVSPKWLYRHHLPFLRRVGRAVRVDPAALDRWLARRA
jgi:excisionase family DNA binding protein